MAGQELAHALQRRQCSGEIEADAAEKLGVAGEVGRHDLKFPQLGEDMIVNEIVSRDIGVAGEARSDNADAGACHLSARAYEDCRLAQPLRGDQAAPVDRGHFAVIHGVQCLMRVVFGVAVSEVRSDEKPVVPRQCQNRRRRKQLQARQSTFRRRASGSVGRAVTYPFQDRPIILGIDIESFPAAVSDRGGRFQKQQAPGGIRDADAGNTLALRLCRQHLVAAALADPFVIVRRVQRAGR